MFLFHDISHFQFVDYECCFLLILYYLLWQLCSGVDENAAGACAQLVFAPIDESFGDDAPLLPSGFRVIPLDAKPVSIFYLLLQYHFFYSLYLFFVFFLRVGTSWGEGLFDYC